MLARGTVLEFQSTIEDNLAAFSALDAGLIKPQVGSVTIDNQSRIDVGYKLPEVPETVEEIPFYRQYISATNGLATDYLMAYLQDLQQYNREL